MGLYICSPSKPSLRRGVTGWVAMRYALMNSRWVAGRLAGWPAHALSWPDVPLGWPDPDPLSWPDDSLLQWRDAPLGWPDPAEWQWPDPDPGWLD